MDRRRDVAREIARIYCPLTPSGVEQLASILIPMKFQKGNTILPEGKVCNALYFVERGMVRQFYYKNKRRFVGYCLQQRLVVLVHQDYNTLACLSAQERMSPFLGLLPT